MMGVVANGGALDGRSVLSAGTLEQLTRERIHGPDKVLPFEISWAAGLMRNDGLKVFGPDEAFGHYGWGGSMAMADPSRRLSAAYVMTRQSPHLIGDPRPKRLLDALYAAL
jgi:CubicO group peptidase (beta-lactamase class C family)